MKSLFCILSADLRFWTGQEFVHDFAKAKLYDTKGAMILDLRTIPETVVTIVATNYGSADQKLEMYG